MLFQTVSKAVSAELSIDCRTWHLVLRVTVTLPYPPPVVRSYAHTNTSNEMMTWLAEPTPQHMTNL